jgi:hypothetical protein
LSLQGPSPQAFSELLPKTFLKFYLASLWPQSLEIRSINKSLCAVLINPVLVIKLHYAFAQVVWLGKNLNTIKFVVTDRLPVTGKNSSPAYGCKVWVNFFTNVTVPFGNFYRTLSTLKYYRNIFLLEVGRA